MNLFEKAKIRFVEFEPDKSYCFCNYCNNGITCSYEIYYAKFCKEFSMIKEIPIYYSDKFDGYCECFLLGVNI